MKTIFPEFYFRCLPLTTKKLLSNLYEILCTSDEVNSFRKKKNKNKNQKYLIKFEKITLTNKLRQVPVKIRKNWTDFPNFCLGCPFDHKKAAKFYEILCRFDEVIRVSKNFPQMLTPTTTESLVTYSHRMYGKISSCPGCEIKRFLYEV